MSVQTITRIVYQASDGTEFSEEERANKYEAMLAQVAPLLSPLGEKYTDTWQTKRGKTDFSNGGGYVQHDPQVIARIREQLVGAVRPYLGFDERVGFMGAARWADDSGTRIYRAFSRLMCIDQRGREWGQTYFALNPDKGEQICLR